MSKAHRGAGIRELPLRGRGMCPLCKRTGIKTMYEEESGEKKATVCKQCHAAIAKGKMKEALASLP